MDEMEQDALESANGVKTSVLSDLKKYTDLLVGLGDFETAARCRDAHDVIKGRLKKLPEGRYAVLRNMNADADGSGLCWVPIDLSSYAINDEGERLQAAVHELEETVEQEEDRANENAREIHRLRKAIGEAIKLIEPLVGDGGSEAHRVLQAALTPPTAPAAGSADYDRGVECDHE